MSTNTQTAVTQEPPKQSLPFPLPIAIPNLFSFLPKFNFQLPFLPSKPKAQPQPKPEPQEPNPKVNFVRFPQTQGAVVPSSTLQAEPDQSVTARTSNPLILWQVYAIAAALISTWVWARWNERKGGGGSPSDDSTGGRPSDDANQ